MAYMLEGPLREPPDGNAQPPRTHGVQTLGFFSGSRPRAMGPGNLGVMLMSHSAQTLPPSGTQV